MMKTQKSYNSSHLAGIIPIAGSKSEFGFEWPGCFVPVAPNFNAIEMAVLECAYLGCESIWIVCNDDVSPLIKHRLGDYVRNVNSLERGSFASFPSEKYLNIPMYYVPIHPKHRDKIDCYAWSILHGANVAYWMCRRLSRWLMPDKYYVSFPFGAYNPFEAQSMRLEIRKREDFYFSFEGGTIRDGLPLGFTFDESGWKQARDIIKSNSRMYYPPEQGEEFPSRLLPPEERHASRNYDLADVFGGLGSKKEKIKELEWFYDLTTWEGYCTLLSSPHRKELARPSKLVFPGGRLNTIGENNG
tara:strand:- start:13041 stop:13943 length:903 start_codon:yes stop_codon:yes gene_type:complete